MKINFHFRAKPLAVAVAVYEQIVLGRHTPFGTRYAPDSDEGIALVSGALVLVGQRQCCASNGLTATEQTENAIGWIHPLTQSGLREVWNAIIGWATGQEFAPYKWEQEDDIYPVNDGVHVEGKSLKVWVNNSCISMVSLGQEHFECFAEGNRHSFGANHTGKIGEAALGLGSQNESIHELTVTSQAAQPWDRELGRLFRPTRVAEVRHVLMSGDDALLNGIHSPTVKRAYRALTAALEDPTSNQEHQAAMVNMQRPAMGWFTPVPE